MAATPNRPKFQEGIGKSTGARNSEMRAPAIDA
jgi:hypothetical protein